MIQGERARQRIFTIAMWAVSVVFAGFLIGFGALVIGDLPRASAPVTLADFVDRDAMARAEADQAQLAQSRAEIERRLTRADQALAAAAAAYEAEKASFDNWIETRTATTDPAQDPEVLARTRRLDTLKAAELEATLGRDEIQQELNAADSQAGEAFARIQELEAQPQYESARFVQDLQIFGLRFLFTLPLLSVAIYFISQPKGDLWPLKRGFIIFAAFAFFVELVPYLPEYGGYIRYGVGIILTIVVSFYVNRWMRAYLKSREIAERQRHEAVREAEISQAPVKQEVRYDEALRKMATKICPRCDRALEAAGDKADFCVHCGLRLFDQCGQCNARKMAFYRFCMSCGAPAKASPAGQAGATA